MVVFNVTSGFEPFGAGSPIITSMFPSGCELNVRIPLESLSMRYEENVGPIFDGHVMLTARISSSDDLMKVMLIADALHRMKAVKEISLFIPFLPYARQDHLVATGEALSLKVVASMLNLCKFDDVIVFDPHSDVAQAVIDNVTVHSNLALVKKVLEGKSNYWIASPDAGAYKKVGKLADQLGYDKQVIACGKVRDPHPLHKGKILGMSVPNINLDGQDVYIIDDIVEGGMTFITLAKELRKQGVGKVFLIVSHGVFSKGDVELKNHLNGIFTSDSFVLVVPIDPDFVKRVPLCHILT